MPPETTPDTRPLVCLGGRVADLRRTAQSIVDYLLAPLDAGLFVYCPRRLREDPATLEGLEALLSLSKPRPAKVEFWDEDAYLARLVRRSSPSRLKKLLAISGSWLGGLWTNFSETARQTAVKGEVFTYVMHERCLHYYQSLPPATWQPEAVIYTRTDFRWVCPHPPLSMLEAAHGRIGIAKEDGVWIPSDGWSDFGGVYDNHAVLRGGAILAFLGGVRLLFYGNAATIMEGFSVSGKRSWLIPEDFLAQRLNGFGLWPPRRYIHCAYRTCGDLQFSKTTLSRRNLCDPKTGGRYEYSWEWSAAQATKLCLQEFHKQAGASASEQAWSVRALRTCFLVRAPYPEDLGFPVMASSTPGSSSSSSSSTTTTAAPTAEAEQQDRLQSSPSSTTTAYPSIAACAGAFEDAKSDLIFRFSGAPVHIMAQPEGLPDPGTDDDENYRWLKRDSQVVRPGWMAEHEQRAECRGAGFAYVRMWESITRNAFGLCVPANCGQEEVLAIAYRYGTMSGLLPTMTWTTLRVSTPYRSIPSFMEAAVRDGSLLLP